MRFAGSATHALLERLQRSAEEIGAPLVAFSIAPHDPFLFIPGLPEPAEVVEAEREGRDYETKLSRELARAGETLGFRTFSVDHAMLRAVRSGDNLNNGDREVPSDAHLWETVPGTQPVPAACLSV